MIVGIVNLECLASAWPATSQGAQYRAKLSGLFSILLYFAPFLVDNFIA